jgi:hypothetical protein
MITDRRVAAIYEEMSGYVLTLDSTSPSPRYFVDKITTCRNYLNNVSIVWAELMEVKSLTDTEFHSAQTVYELECSRLLVTDEAVRRLANIKDRESMVNHILREQVQRLAQLKDQRRVIDAVLKYVNHRSRELHSTMDAIKSQRRFMAIEVSVGSFYGDERLPPHEIAARETLLDFNENEIRGLLGSGDQAVEVDNGISGPADLNIEPEVVEPPPPFPAAAVAQETAILDDDLALKMFLGEGTGPHADASTVEPPKSVVQTEDVDLSNLLDFV